MKLSHERKVRPKFLAAVLLALSLALLFGGEYTIGLWVPMSISSLLLFISTSDNVLSIYPIWVYKIAFYVFSIIGVITLLLFGSTMSVSWFLTAIVFSLSFKFVRVFMGIIGLAGLFTNA
jgi:hypothetical protein